MPINIKKTIQLFFQRAAGYKLKILHNWANIFGQIWQDFNLARKQAYIKAEKRSIIVSLYFGQPSGPCLDQMCYLQARTEDICAEACVPHPRGLYPLPEWLFMALTAEHLLEACGTISW